jgi:hypothetical protein
MDEPTDILIERVVRTLARALAVNARARAICGETVLLIATAHRLRRWPRRLSGASDLDLDASLIAPILTHRAVCLDCLVRETRLRSEQVRRVARRLERARVLTHATAACNACACVASVHRLRDLRDGGSRRREPLTVLYPNMDSKAGRMTP